MRTFLYLLCALCFGSCSNRKPSASFYINGLQQPVEIFRDSNGVNHIYAQTEHDLFFAQGYAAARDRLFQLEIWRRQATGTLSEILGSREIKRDIGARLFQFRGDLTKELNHYHPRGEAIIQAFVNGINAWIEQTEQQPELLAPEFTWLNFRPGRWTPRDVISRHQGLLANLTDEIIHGRAVALLGPEKVKELRNFEPGEPRLQLDSSIDPEGLFEPVIEPYEAFRKPITFLPEDVMEPFRTTNALRQLSEAINAVSHEEYPSAFLGSNNWVISGSKTATGHPLLANDPHRIIAMPSLRYIVHLNGPGWNVIGGGEPSIPGVSIGHNEHGAWGLTVFRIDMEDLMVYDINPSNPNQYRYRNNWEDMKLIYDTLRIRGAPDTVVIHRYTRHGPVTFVDLQRRKAYAVRCAWLEPGCAPYLASLRMNTSTSWQEFREACTYSYLPGENMIWADRKGKIGWQVVGLAPIRRNWDGLVPVPGDGRYEWDGFLPIKELPHVFSPKEGFWATANENLVIPGYPHRYAVGWEWADSSRSVRIREVLQSKDKLTVEDMKSLQCDYVSVPARILTSLLRETPVSDDRIKWAVRMLINWDCRLDKKSIAAGLYMMWEGIMTAQAYERLVPQRGREVIRSISVRKMIEWLRSERIREADRHTFLVSTLKEAIQRMEKNFGPDTTRWHYGQPDYHHVRILHPLYHAVNDSIKALISCGPLPRGGSASTPNVTGNNLNQTHGASFRMVADLSDWDNTWFTNAPGQSGDVRSAFFKNLFEPWAVDQYFRSYFTHSKIVGASVEKVELTPVHR
jgi:penicillin amidase